MRTNQAQTALAGWIFGGTFACMLAFSAVSCRSPQPSSPRRAESTIDSASYGPYPVPPWQEVRHASLQAPVPEIAGAEFVNDDSLCMTCHETHVKTFQHNVHRDQSCEQCHGPASLHLKSRGKEPGTILSFKTLSPPDAPNCASSVTNRMRVRLELSGGRRPMPRTAYLARTATRRTTTCPLARRPRPLLRTRSPPATSAW